MPSKELLRRIDEKDYLTEREHREFLDRLKKDLEILEILKVESCLIWVENGKLYSGRYGDIEIPLDEDDFNGKENYEKIKEWLDGRD